MSIPVPPSVPLSKVRVDALVLALTRATDAFLTRDGRLTTIEVLAALEHMRHALTESLIEQLNKGSR